MDGGTWLVEEGEALMPSYPKHPCAHPLCRALVTRKERWCPAHQRGDDRKTSAQRGYDTQWQRARLEFLRANPLCASCLKEGRTIAATVVDHVVPHRGDDRLFWDRSNWQSLCDYRSPYNCHGVKTGKGL